MSIELETRVRLLVSRPGEAGPNAGHLVPVGSVGICCGPEPREPYAAPTGRVTVAFDLDDVGVVVVLARIEDLEVVADGTRLSTGEHPEVQIHDGGEPLPEPMPPGVKRDDPVVLTRPVEAVSLDGTIKTTLPGGMVGSYRGSGQVAFMVPFELDLEPGDYTPHERGVDR